MFFAIGRPQFAAGFGRNRRQLVDACDGPGRAVEIGNPNLRPTFFIGDERKPLSIRRPTRTVAVLIGNEDALVLCGGGALPRLDGAEPRPHTFLLHTLRIQRHDPDVRSLLVRSEIDIDGRK